MGISSARSTASSASDFDAVDFFRAQSLYQNPYPYYDYLRRLIPRT